MMVIYMMQVGEYSAGQGGYVGIAVSGNGFLFTEHLSTTVGWLKIDLVAKYPSRYPAGSSTRWLDSSSPIYERLVKAYKQWQAGDLLKGKHLQSIYADEYNGPIKLY